MNRSSRPRKTANLSELVHRQLNMYAIAAGAALVVALALAQPVEAKIVYTKAHVVIEYNNYYNLDLNRDGVADFTISVKSSRGDPCYTSSVTEQPSSGNGVVGQPPVALNRGAEIGPGQQFYGRAGTMAFQNYRCYQGGPWFNVDNRYLGLSFQRNGQTHYGWARLSVQFHSYYFTATLTGYAYETIPGKAIKAGPDQGPGKRVGRR